ncbi:MFS transporter [Thioclava sp. FTW29]|uniref:MFS transporter n=1 Tax=Thioclava litoralis TaxID=3076557 RepID=A0ABZ1E5A1_9RHOB|nr:MFS transporter [Thioclava sp. FTW29]
MTGAPAMAGPGGQAPAGGPPKGPGGPPPFTRRTAAALAGILLGALMSGVNNRVGALALTDISAQVGAASDAASWIETSYTAGELLVMPFAGWFAITLGLRRFHQIALAICCFIAILLPFTLNLQLFIGLRFVQGMAAGCLVPVLMMAALKFMPANIRLHGLALYSMTATVAPNIAVSFTAFWQGEAPLWQWLYWQIIPAGICAAALVHWGLPNDPIIWPRFRQGNWLGMSLGIPGLGLLVVALTQGNRLEWFETPFITWSLCASVLLILAYLVTEWRHSAPFIKPQLLARRNLWLGFSLLLCVLVLMLSASLIPATALGALHGFKALQVAPLSLIVAVPQVLVAPAVALLLYRKWIDARLVLSTGLIFIGIACWINSRITATWMADQFVLAQILQCLGQPMFIVSLLFLATSVVHPMEGPYIAGTVNTIRAFGTTLGSALIEKFLEYREAFHAEHMQDSIGRLTLPMQETTRDLFAVVPQQALILSSADVLIVLGSFAFLLAPVGLLLKHIPAPDLSKGPPPAPVAPRRDAPPPAASAPVTS